MSTATEIEKFLAAIHDPDMFCEGRICTYSRKPIAFVSNKPNCGIVDDCPLFRSPRGPVVKMWYPAATGDPDRGCVSHYLLQRWNRSQQYWIVQFDRHEEQEVQGGDVLDAACAAWWERVRNGEPIDKMFLFDKLYSVREA